MKIVEKIFKDPYYITSGWGNRTYYLNGKKVSDFHNGIDYGTNGKKIPQYAVEDGYVISCGVDTKYGNAKYAWVAYPRIGKKLLYYHLDSISVKKGQEVKEGTEIGKTGMTGYATGIHLHLGMKDINGGDYQNAEEYNYIPASNEPKKDLKSVDEVAKEVIEGKWGNGEERKTKLRGAGYSYTAVQTRVNEILAGNKESAKKYLNLKPNISAWTVYKTNGLYRASVHSDVLVILNPKKYGGLTYEILEDMGNYHFKIKTDMKGIGYISGNPNKYSCTITEEPVYKYGNY